MDFLILGPLEMRHHGTALTLNAARQRAVLAVLLLRANRTVPVGVLIEELWGDRPPRTADVTVRNYICRIRRVLPEPVLRTTSAGYEMRVDGDNLDLHQFERLVAKARPIIAERPAEAASTLVEALAMWRGPALGDCGSAWVRRHEGPRLEEMRLAALEDLVNAELRQGHHAALVAELVTLTARYPLRERLAAQLMIALHRSGRRSEALRVYQRTRRHMIAELGLEPGRELRLVQRHVLQDTDWGDRVTASLLG